MTKFTKIALTALVVMYFAIAAYGKYTVTVQSKTAINSELPET